ncbi:UDP-N-acetylmuramate dehydrogenase [Candidatus Purcelliella pentastirinorum]|uniref:UDP-N-acetylenolpyruvoylglucosamine reductase n=1 Tax=Candidatus Purcelliella pentastirinorum TaxID=472834 RepID=A0AAX3N8K7_9ENTR|nr:UDP-N-acetylmuramate dehydrogenase [Candidatus Purcelliella pentastirinorum]WDI78442.1 UDP-N-acetylmuramate dehydrogenase [Candidatus Purcelliella pentastirinorum]WDR80529.1 UDP-N-acetylmuramate dehydrogenase [Candidatus Purcelliella pentastirinorum]
MISLKNFHTFGIDLYSKGIFFAKTVGVISKYWLICRKFNIPFILLGCGSNVFFLKNYFGLVIVNLLKGILIEEKLNEWLLHVKSGEIWHDLVKYTMSIGIFGLENLAFIPGSVGSAAVQNIGAYGLEFKDICEYVEITDLNNLKVYRFKVKDCLFGYRSSIFMYGLKKKYIVTGVGIKLNKKWCSITSYINFNIKSFTPIKIYNIIYNIRKSKIPDPKLVGNVGSFFKNPIIDLKLFKKILFKYKNVPYYKLLDGTIKLSGGWLIDQCGLRGYSIGGASINKKQSLVILNINNATSYDIICLARKIRIDVSNKFNVCLIPEVRFIGKYGEIDPLSVI